MMFGRVSTETLLNLKQYVLKYGSKDAADFFTALHVSFDNGTIIVEEAVPAFTERDDVPFADSFRVQYEERARLENSNALESYLMRLKRNLVNADHPGDFAELHYCLYVPLFDSEYWDQASTIIRALDKDVFPKPQVDLVGFCADMADAFPGYDKDSYESYLNVTRETLKKICDFRATGGPLHHVIALDNKQLSGVALNANEKTLIPILGEFALLVVESYSGLFNGLLEDKDLCSLGIASMSIDHFYFIEYLLRRTYMHVLERENVNDTEVDYNKMSLLTQNILSKWVHLMSDFYKKEVKPRRQQKKDDHTVVVEITPLLHEKFQVLVNEVDAYIHENELDIPQKRAFLAVLLGQDDASLINSIFNEKELIIQDLEREAIQVFIDSNNTLLNREDTKSTALLSLVLDRDNPEAPVYYPLDQIKRNRISIKHCVSTIRELEKNEERLKAQLVNQVESEKCLIKNGTITFKGQSFKLLPTVVDPPLQEQYEPHKVTSTSIDLRSNFTAIRNQGPVGSCLSHALASIYEYFLRCNGLVAPDLSELFLYYNARDIDGKADEDTGSTLQASMKSLAEQGICDEREWPYNPSNFNVKPSEAAYQDALTRKVKTSLNVELNADAVKSALEDGLPVAISLNLYESFTTGAHGFIPMPSADEKQSEEHGRHAMVICGFSDEQKVFVVRNSWGLDFGDNGYCYIPYAYIANPALTNWAAVIKEIVTAENVDGPSRVIDNKVFSIKDEKRSHVNFDHTDAEMTLMATQASLAEQRALLDVLEEDDRKLSAYYAQLKQQLIDKNLQNRLKDATINRLDLEIQEKAARKDEIEQTKFKELKLFDKATFRRILHGSLIALGILVGGIVTNKIVHHIQDKQIELAKIRLVEQQEQQAQARLALDQEGLSDTKKAELQTILRQPPVVIPKRTHRIIPATLFLFGLVLMIMGVVYLLRIKKRKQIENEFNEQIESIGVQIHKLEDEKDITAIRFFMSGYILSNLFDMNDKLSERYNILKSFQNNLITWYDALEDEDPNKDRGSHPTSVTLLTPDVLDKFFDEQKDAVTEDLKLSDFLDGFVLNEDGIVRLKKALENAVIGKIIASLDDFSIYRYLAKLQDYPYLPKVKDAHLINTKLEELATKSLPFLQMKATAGALNPQSTIFINVPESELNNWNSIYPNSFSIRPNTCNIDDKEKIAVTNIQQLDLKDVQFM